MAKKRFELDAEAAPAAPRQSAAAIMLERMSSPVESVEAVPPVEQEEPKPKVAKRRPRAKRDIEPEQVAEAPKKKRYPTALGKKRLIQLGSPEQDEELDDFVRDLKKVAGHNPSLSLLARVGLSIIMRSKQELITELRESDVPPWAPARDAKGFCTYEDFWDRAVSRATLRRVDP